VTFAWPLALLGLLVLPLLVLLESWARRRKPRYAVAFSNLGVLRGVAVRTPNWRRRVRLALLLLAAAALVFGLARPRVPITVAKRDGTVILALDTSGSMVSTDVSPSRLGAATSAAKSFVDGLPPNFQVGLVPFSSSAQVAVAPTTDRSQIHNALNGLQANGGTAIGDAIQLSLGLQGTGPTGAAKGKGKEILLLSDGSNNSGMDPMAAASEAKAQGVRVDTIAFGTPDGTVNLGPLSGGVQRVPPDPATLRDVAHATGGTFFAAADEQSLKGIYRRVGLRIGSTKGHKEVTYQVAALAAVLLLAAGATAIRWRGSLA
jgi:Ca-activated chloride channel family protein